KLTGIFLVGPVTSCRRLQNFNYNEAVQQRLRAKNPDLARFRIIPPSSIDIRPCDDWDQSIRCADIRNPSTPSDLPAAILERVRNVMISRNQSPGRRPGQQPYPRIVAVDVKRTREDVFLIKQTSSGQFPYESFRPLRI